MRLESFEIRNYRSIRDLIVEPCGDFNVLIGRNNSGKSNILGSIEAFFAAIKPEIINTKPSVGAEIDFFQRDVDKNIELRATLAPLPSELEQLLAEVALERPQVKKLLEEIRQDSRLVVAVLFTRQPKTYAYVQSIALQTTDGSRTIFEIDKKAAEELYTNVAGMERSTASNESLNRAVRQFDADDYAASKRPRGREQFAPPPVEYYFRRFVEDDTALTSELIKLFQSSENYESFTSSVANLVKANEATIEALSKRPIGSPIRTFTGDDDSVPEYVKLLLSRIGSTQLLHFKERRAPIGSEEAKRLLSLKIRRGGTETLERIQSTIDELLGVKVDAFEGPTDARGQASAELDVDQFLIQANGSGIREALRLILDTEFQKPTLLLVEEPEIHLHPALETSIMGYLKGISTERQVFITTHSTNFLDTGNFQNVFLVQKNGSTQLSSLSLAEAEEKLPGELGIRLSSLFMYDQIIFVEGPSDEQIIREFAKTLGTNLGQLNTGFIQMNGVRNLGHYAAAEILSFLTKRRVKLFFLVDADETESFHFRRLREKFADNASIHVLRKREIENYLLSPVANIKHLSLRKRASREELPHFEQDRFRDLELEAAESLKDLAIWKRILSIASRPLYPDRPSLDSPTPIDEMKALTRQMLERAKAEADMAIAGLDQLYDDSAKTVETDWSNKKLDIVPGSAILDRVYKKFDMRYDKMRDGIGVASQMSRSEIDTELKNFIKALSSGDGKE